MKVIFDLESDGLLDECTKIYCFCYYNIETNESVSLTNYDDIINIVTDKNNTLIGHNIIRFDVPVLEKILKCKVRCKLIDTLALSWYLYPMRTKHGLESWGEDFGVPKPIVLKNEWKGLSLDEDKIIQYYEKLRR